jgi:hypothetical protein
MPQDFILATPHTLWEGPHGISATLNFCGLQVPEDGWCVRETQFCGYDVDVWKCDSCPPPTLSTTVVKTPSEMTPPRSGHS